MNPDRITDLNDLPEPPAGRDLRVWVTGEEIQIRGEVPNGAWVNLDNPQLQAGWLELPDDAAVAAVTRLATDPDIAAQEPYGVSLRDLRRIGAHVEQPILTFEYIKAVADGAHLGGNTSGELVLNEQERVAVVAGLRWSASVRDVDQFEWGETYADISSDPTYAGDQAASDAYMERELRSHEASAARAADETRPYEELADQVERTGRVDLNDPDTRKVMVYHIEDIGADMPGEEVMNAPAELWRVVPSGPSGPRGPRGPRCRDGEPARTSRRSRRMGRS